MCLGPESAHYCRDVGQPRDAARYHGDQAAAPGMLDFAVNVRSEEPPSWLVERLAARLRDLAHYPSADDVRRATRAVALRHGRGEDEVALLAGGAEGFALLPRLRPRLRRWWRRRSPNPKLLWWPRACRCTTSCSIRPSRWRGPTFPTVPTSSCSGIRRIRRRCSTPATRSWRCAGPAASLSSTRRSRMRSLASPNRLPRHAERWRRRVAQPHQDVGTGGPSRRLRARRRRRAGQVDERAPALAAGHAATRSCRGVLLAGGRRRGRRLRRSAGSDADRDGGGLLGSWARRRRRPRPLRVVRVSPTPISCERSCMPRESPFGAATPSSDSTAIICASRCDGNGRTLLDAIVEVTQ